MYCCLPMKVAGKCQQGHALHVQPALVTSVGLAHLVYPTVFEPLNRALGFRHNTRRRVYIHGLIEMSIGLLSASSRTRRFAVFVGAGYLFYLSSHAVCSRTAR